jgi:alpha-L-arabinofuranosidase
MNKNLSGILLILMVLISSCHKKEAPITIMVYPDSVLNDVSNHPVGINVDYFMDDDNYLKPAIRTDDALKAIGVKFLRYPGGNKSDLYLFSVPPYKKSQPTLARTGKGAIDYERVVKDYKEYRFDVLDFDEFIGICREVGAEPLIVVAADEYLVKYPEGSTWTNREGLIKNAVEWVRYANIKKGYNVKYWMIGNECWHNNNENSSAEIYAKDVVDFSIAMKAVDPSIFVIPNGNSVEFFKDVLTIASGHIDYLCLSNYPVFNYTAGYVSYRDTLKDLMGPVKRALTAISNYASEEDKKKLKLLVVEYGPFDWAYKWPMINDMGHNLCNFEMTGEQLKMPEIEFSCFWNTRWIENDTIENSVFDALDKNGNFNANGLGLMIWGNWLGKKMVSTTGTLHIRSFASYSPDENSLYIYLLNKNQKPANIKVIIEGYKTDMVEKAAQLTGTGPDDVDPVWNNNLSISKRDLRNLELPGTSISVVKLKTIKN